MLLFRLLNFTLNKAVGASTRCQVLNNNRTNIKYEMKLRVDKNEKHTNQIPLYRYSRAHIPPLFLFAGLTLVACFFFLLYFLRFTLFSIHSAYAFSMCFFCLCCGCCRKTGRECVFVVRFFSSIQKRLQSMPIAYSQILTVYFHFSENCGFVVSAFALIKPSDNNQ